jgi:hypothetical protein
MTINSNARNTKANGITTVCRIYDTKKFNTMRLIIIFIISSFNLLVLSCQKDNNGIAIPTYKLESILIETTSSMNSYIDSTIIRTDSAFLDSLFQLSFNPGLSMYEQIRTNGDSLLYTTIPDISGLYSHAKASFFQNRYSSTSFFSANQYYVNGADVSYVYSTANRLSGFNMITEQRHEAYLDLIQNSQCTASYINNDLSRINFTASYRSDNVYIDSNYYNIDTTIQRDSFVTLSYLSVKNQKNLIGIDVNDLIFNDFINAFGFNMISYGGLIHYPFLEKVLLLNGKISYNTNSQHLINNIEFGRATGIGHSFIFPPYIINVDYNFDNAYNNRINALEITNDINYPTAYSTTTKYTFYYKD